MKTLPKTLTITAIASLVAAAGISFAQSTTTDSPTRAEVRAEGAEAARSLPNRLDGSGSQGSRNDYNTPTVVQAPAEQPAPVAAQPTITESAPAVVVAPEPAVEPAAPVAEPSTEVAPVERAPQADRN